MICQRFGHDRSSVRTTTPVIHTHTEREKRWLHFAETLGPFLFLSRSRLRKTRRSYEEHGDVGAHTALGTTKVIHTDTHH